MNNQDEFHDAANIAHTQLNEWNKHYNRIPPKGEPLSFQNNYLNQWPHGIIRSILNDDDNIKMASAKIIFKKHNIPTIHSHKIPIQFSNEMQIMHGQIILWKVPKMSHHITKLLIHTQ